MNPRAIKEADALVDAGYDVHLIATRLSNRLDALDADILDTAKWSFDILDFTPRSTWLFERSLSWCANKICSIFKPLSKRFFLAKYAHSPFTRRLTKVARCYRADLFIGHYPAALPAAALAAKRQGSAFAYDAEDFHLGDLPDTPSNAIKNNLIATIEGLFLRDATYVSAAAPGIADEYVRRYDVQRPSVILNTFPKRDAPPVATDRGCVQPGPSLYWFSQVRGRDRGLEHALDAISQTKSCVHLYIRGAPQDGFDEKMIARAHELGCRDRLHFLDPAKPSQMMHTAAQYDIGLSGETGVTKNRQIALPNKHFTYLLAGVPVVMSDIPAHLEFAQDISNVCNIYSRDDPKSLTRILDSLLSDEKSLTSLRRAAFDLGQTRYNWELESQKLCALVDQSLN